MVEYFLLPPLRFGGPKPRLPITHEVSTFLVVNGCWSLFLRKMVPISQYTFKPIILWKCKIGREDETKEAISKQTERLKKKMKMDDIDALKKTEGAMI